MKPAAARRGGRAVGPARRRRRREADGQRGAVQLALVHVLDGGPRRRGVGVDEVGEAAVDVDCEARVSRSRAVGMGRTFGVHRHGDAAQLAVLAEYLAQVGLVDVLAELLNRNLSRSQPPHHLKKERDAFALSGGAPTLELRLRLRPLLPSRDRPPPGDAAMSLGGRRPLRLERASVKRERRGGDALPVLDLDLERERLPERGDIERRCESEEGERDRDAGLRERDGERAIFSEGLGWRKEREKSLESNPCHDGIATKDFDIVRKLRGRREETFSNARAILA